jgi:hypothetical protein
MSSIRNPGGIPDHGERQIQQVLVGESFQVPDRKRRKSPTNNPDNDTIGLTVNGMIFAAFSDQTQKDRTPAAPAPAVPAPWSSSVEWRLNPGDIVEVQTVLPDNTAPVLVNGEQVAKIPVTTGGKLAGVLVSY